MKKEAFIVLFCCLYVITVRAMFYPDCMLPRQLFQSTLSEEMAQEYIATSEKYEFEPSELVLYKHPNKSFSFARVEQCEAHTYSIELLNTQEHLMVPGDILFPLALFWKVMFQPLVSIMSLKDMISAYLCSIPLHLKPYIKTIGVNPGSHYLTISDIHGDIHALQRIICDWYNKDLLDKHLTLKQGYKVIGLGDYQDRGEFGIEVLCVLLILSLKNPGSVYLLCGNHEIPSMVVEGTFMEEWCTKFGDSAVVSQTWDLINFLFGQLPSGLLVGLIQRDASRVEPYLMFCHGGICSILDIRSMLLNHRVSRTPEIDHDIEAMHDYALRWTDFYAPAREEVAVGYGTSRPALFRNTGLPEFTKIFFEDYMRYFATCRGKSGTIQARLLALVRGHQHNRGGVVSLNRYLEEGTEGLVQYLSSGEKQDYEWRILTNREKHFVEPADVYTITSASAALWGQGWRTHNYALIHASKSGEWKLTPFSV
jgi:hypothetical protein